MTGGDGHRRGFAILWLAAGVAAGATGMVVAGSAVLAAVDGGMPRVAGDPPRFVDEADAAGIDHVYDGDFSYFVGGGVAVFDCDGDGKPDLYFAGGESHAALYRNESLVGGALRFEKVGDSGSNLTGVTGAYPLDVDGDGVTDLAVLRVGENRILRGLGACRFEAADQALSIDGGDEWTVGFSATWEGPQALPTLAFGNYVALTPSGEQAGGCSDNVLMRPDGDGYGAAVPLTPGWCTLSILFGDWDGSGRRDLRMTNDRHYYRDGEEQLWRIEPRKTPELYTRDDGWQPMQIWGMGIAEYDLTGDGMPEVFLTSQGDNKLQTLAAPQVDPPRPEYRDIAFPRGLTAHRPYTGDVSLPSTAWHPEFDDVNNDGLIDLFVSKGNVEAMPEYAMRDPSNLLLGRPDGTFAEAAQEAGIVTFARGRGAALADLNLDGMLDLVQVNRRERVGLWRNVGSGTAATPGAMGHWVAVRLGQPGPNRDAIGAWIEVRAGRGTSRREVLIGGGHAGGELGWIHFGIGEEPTAELRVRWPDGEMGRWMNVSSDRFVVVERGSSEAVTWTPQGGVEP